MIFVTTIFDHLVCFYRTFIFHVNNSTRPIWNLKIGLFFAKKDGGNQDGLLTLGGHWFLLLGIFLGGHDDGKPANFHNTKSYSIFFTIWNVSSNVVWPLWFMIGWGSTTSLHLFVLFKYVQLHQLSFHASITIFLCKFFQLHTHDAWSIILFPLEILDLLHLIFVNAPNFHFQKLEKISNGSNGSGSLMVINGTCNVA